MDFNDNKPIYLQLVDQIMDEVERPGFEHQARLPSVREYALSTGVNPNTVMRAYTLLQQNGIIHNKRGVGYFYEPNAKENVLRIRREQFFSKELPYIIDRMIVLGISPKEIEKCYNQTKENLNN